MNNQIQLKSNYFHTIEVERRKKITVKLPILIYHYVENVTDEKDTIRKSLNIPPDIFSDQINTLLQAGFQPIHLTELVSYFDGKINLPKKPVIFTFDDGYRDFYTDVVPILLKYRIKATLFMTSGFLDYTQNYLTSDQIKEISKNGFVEIAAHSVDHFGLVSLTESEMLNQISKSKIDLENLLGIKIFHFAYPYGLYSPEVIKAVINSGFLTASTVDTGTGQNYANRFQLKRIRPGRNVGFDLLRLLEAN